ncbi:hypothetical protein BGZ57DRAFT_856588 [Hyaloscypha finlandica]|nr:hypothetical protein BGZ57DRAFT_856588 [Hyaloscypha finlandica]
MRRARAAAEWESSLGVKLGEFGGKLQAWVFQSLAGRLAGWQRMLQQLRCSPSANDRPPTSVLDSVSVSVAARPAGTFAASLPSAHCASRWPARFGSDAKAGEGRRLVARPNKNQTRKTRRWNRPQENPGLRACRRALQPGWLAGGHSQAGRWPMTARGVSRWKDVECVESGGWQNCAFHIAGLLLAAQPTAGGTCLYPALRQLAAFNARRGPWASTDPG